MKDEIRAAAVKNGISQTGFVRAEIFSSLAPFLDGKTVMTEPDIQKRINPFIGYEWAKTFIVCLLPYFTGGERSEISRYAWGKDYHAVMREYLSPVCLLLQDKGYRAEIICDNHSLNDRFLAYKAGLGFFGRNGFLINERCGTYTFIGSVVTDAEIEPDRPSGKKCAECGRCARACPGGAISETGINAERCVSYITQKKGELTKEEKSVIKKSGYIWGCDICQEVCPHNENAEMTDIGAFRDELIKSPVIDGTMSNREFRRKYSERAFAWRGKQTILRNIRISEGENL